MNVRQVTEALKTDMYLCFIVSKYVIGKYKNQEIDSITIAWLNI